MSLLHLLRACGQRPWLDVLRHCHLTDGTLQQLIELGISGITSNPTIFYQALSECEDYEETISEFKRKGIRDPKRLFLELARRDVHLDCDLLKPIYDMEEGFDGFVSYEIDPHLAYDAEKSIEVARQRFHFFERPNVMIKIPATMLGLEAIEALSEEGINVNVTLLFSPNRYREVAEAYMRGLERRLARGESLENITSVASFFVSRIDVAVDRHLAEVASPDQQEKLSGWAAMIQTVRAYQIYRELMASERWRKLAKAGAKPQRLLWASMGVKRQGAPPLKYVEALIAPETVSTLPLSTIETFLKEALVTVQLDRLFEETERVAAELQAAVIDLEALEQDGVEHFVESFEAIFKLLGERLAA